MKNFEKVILTAILIAFSILIIQNSSPTAFGWIVGLSWWVLILGGLCVLVFGVSIYKAFSFRYGAYWFKKGDHYSRGNFFPIKIFFFKKYFEFDYIISPELEQEDEGQINKIAGITSIFFRNNSARTGFKQCDKTGLYYQYVYNYDKGKRIERAQGLRKFGNKYRARAEAPRLIWFGYYNKPYYGGMNATKKAGRVIISKAKKND